VTAAPRSVVVVGGGLAGFTTVQELRRRGFAGELTLIEPGGLPYDRPPLSKGYLSGEAPSEKLDFAPASWFDEHHVTLIADRAVRLAPGPDSVTVTLAGGGGITADIAVLATGGHARRLPVPGGDLPGLHVLRTKADADALRRVLGAGRRLAVIGAGLIGAEVAATAAKAGTQVTLIDPVEVPLVNQVGLALAVPLHAMHAEHGVHTIEGQTTAIERAGDAWLVRVDEGAEHGGYDLEADEVLVAIGIIPDVELAVGAGLDVENGVLVDPVQRTSHPRVYAVGDSARTRLPDGTLLHRHEHWESAAQSGQRAAAAIVGGEQPAATAPWFWSDRYGVHVEGVGSMLAGHVVVREGVGRPAIVFQVGDDGRLLGAAAVDGGTAIKAVRRMIDRGIVVDPEKLADPAVDLKKLAR
jgi:NADPH-dependent 2,4-dienoyl-CoA reductase/sulfur reductase-like enzyme